MKLLRYKTNVQYAEVLAEYVKTFTGSKGVMKKLETVRLRGRKRSMLG